MPQTPRAVADGPGPEEAPLSLGGFLPYRLSVVSECVSRLFARRYEDRFGLTIPEWRVVAVLGESGACSTQEVIERTEMDRVRVSRAVIRLADKTLVMREKLPGDQRAQKLRLTRKGVGIYLQIVPLAHELQAALTAVLDAQERTVLDAALRKLHTRARELAD